MDQEQLPLQLQTLEYPQELMDRLWLFHKSRLMLKDRLPPSLQMQVVRPHIRVLGMRVPTPLH